MAKSAWWGVLLGLSLCHTSAFASGGAHYLFNEGSGSVAIDSSGAGNTGTITGATYVSGYQGTALRFSTNGAVLVPQLVFTGFSNTAYFSAWVNPSAYPPGPFGCDSTIFRKRASSNDWVVSIIGQGQLNCSFPGASGYGGTIPLNTWSKVACWYDGSSMHATINDIEVATTPAHITLDWQSGYYRTEIGNDTTDNGTNCIDYSFRGAIDNVTIASSIPSSTPPSASFTWTPRPPTAGQQVQFTDTSTGSPTSWSWSFGDGTTATAQDPTHTYTVQGSFPVTLTACRATTCDTTTQTLSVDPLPASVHAGFTWTPRPALAGQRIRFADTSTGNPMSWRWDFGDGTTSTLQSPAHVYASAGMYPVSETVAANGITSTARQTVVVTPQPFYDDFSDTTKFSQNWHVNTGNGSGPSGTNLLPENAKPTRGRTGPPYLDLTLSTCPHGGVCGGEVMSNRADLWYGHYRFLVYVPDTRPLTCPQGFVLGLFTYRSDETNEIDIEFLRRIDTRQRNGCSFNQDVTNRIYTVAHTSAGSFPNPDTDHDQPFAVVGSSHLGHIASYGFDWSPAKITFLWNEQPIKTITGAGEVPRDPSHLMLNTWTGADGSGGGVPPKTPIHSRIYSVGYTPDFIPVPPPL